MAAKTVISCDRCGTTRGESNNWFQVSTKRATALIVRPYQPLRFPRSKTSLWRELCGAGCVGRDVSEWVSQQQRTHALIEEQELTPNGTTGTT